MSELYAETFTTFKTLTDNARSAVSRHVYPMLEGYRVKGENDATLLILYKKWQASMRAMAAALETHPYKNARAEMPEMPVDDEEHAPCRQMAAVLIERTIYDEHIAARWLAPAASAIMKNPVCATHDISCACKKGLHGWTYSDTLKTVDALKEFYKASSYIYAIRDLASHYGISEAQMLEREAAQQALIDAAKLEDEKRQETHKKMLDSCAFVQYYDNNMMGYYKVTKRADHYEFMLMDTPFRHPSWRAVVEKHEITKIPLDVELGKPDTYFEHVTPEKICLE